MIQTFNRPREGVTIPRIWIAVAISVLLHVAIFWRAIPDLRHLTFDEPEKGANSGALAVRLAPPSPPTPRTPPPEPEGAPPPPSRKAIAKPPRPKAAPRVIALNKQAASSSRPTPVPAPPVEKTPPPRPPAEMDFASMVKAKQRAREGAAPSPPPPPPSMVASAPAETEAERAKRITSANLAPKQMVFGYDPAAGGGVFQIRSMSLNDAQFAFYGWNRDIKRKVMQLIDVNKGNNADIKIAVVRKMIAMIREEVSDDFTWESRRLGRDMQLSARMRDNAYLEDFMMREFFPDSVVAR